MDAEKNIRALLKAKAEEIPSATVIPDAVLRRSKIRRSLTASLASAVLIAASVGVLAGVRSIVEKPSLDPVNPAPAVTERPDPNVEADRNLAKLKDSAECSVGSSRKGKQGSRGNARSGTTTVVPRIGLGPMEWLAALFAATSATSSAPSGCVEERVDPSPDSGPQGKDSAGRGAGKNK